MSGSTFPQKKTDRQFIMTPAMSIQRTAHCLVQTVPCFVFDYFPAFLTAYKEAKGRHREIDLIQEGLRGTETQLILEDFQYLTLSKLKRRLDNN